MKNKIRKPRLKYYRIGFTKEEIEHFNNHVFIDECQIICDVLYRIQKTLNEKGKKKC